MMIFRLFMIVFPNFASCNEMNCLAFQMALSLLTYAYTRLAIYEHVLLVTVVSCYLSSKFDWLLPVEFLSVSCSEFCN